MIQEIAPHRLDNRYKRDPAPGETDIVLVFGDGQLALRKKEDGGIRLATVHDLADEHSRRALRYLLSLDETAFFLLEALPDPCGEGWVHYPVEDLRRKHPFPQHITFALLTALHLQRWYRDNRYCGRCGERTQSAPDERALQCAQCGRRIYPRINPAVIVGVCNKDEIVLTRYANRPIAYHALVAGFNEIGETLEETVQREVMEEVGLKVKNIRYYKSQPWAVAGDLLSGFFCDVDGDPTIRMDDHELKEAVWVRREDVDGQPDHFSLTNEMMMVFKEGREPKAAT